MDAQTPTSDNWLKAIRAARSSDKDPECPMSQRQAAVLVGVSRQTWAAWESRTRPITMDQVTDIRTGLTLDQHEYNALLKWLATHPTSPR